MGEGVLEWAFGRTALIPRPYPATRPRSCFPRFHPEGSSFRLATNSSGSSLVNSALLTRMRWDMKLRFYAERTQRIYLEHASRYAAFVQEPIDRVGRSEVRRYLIHLLGHGVSCSYFAQASAALRFFYGVVLGRKVVAHGVPRPRSRARGMPTVLSRAEVRNLLAATANLKQRALLAAAYSAGLRASEATRLRVIDIDSERMAIRVRRGKGARDRVVMLAHSLLGLLREYWAQHHPAIWLFPGTDPSRPLSVRRAQGICTDAARRAGLSKRVTMNVLRHSFATHLFESGADLLHVQRLLGHVSPLTTLIYTHVATNRLLAVPSPLDLLPV
jgi:integrase/recombinase XerD